MDVVRVYRVMRDVLDGIAFLHSRGEIYGDLKGPNVLIGTDGTAKLGDFGGVVGAGTLTTHNLAECGTMQFWAPEFFKKTGQTDTQIGSPAGDIWAFGQLLLELLTSRSWIVGESSVEIEKSVLRFDIARVCESEGIVGDLQILLSLLLSKNPSQRIPSAELVRSNRLQSVLGPETPLSRFFNEQLDTTINDLESSQKQLQSTSQMLKSTRQQLQKEQQERTKEHEALIKELDTTKRKVDQLEGQLSERRNTILRLERENEECLSEKANFLAIIHSLQKEKELKEKEEERRRTKRDREERKRAEKEVDERRDGTEVQIESQHAPLSDPVSQGMCPLCQKNVEKANFIFHVLTTCPHTCLNLQHFFWQLFVFSLASENITHGSTGHRWERRRVTSSVVPLPSAIVDQLRSTTTAFTDQCPFCDKDVVFKHHRALELTRRNNPQYSRQCYFCRTIIAVNDSTHISTKHHLDTPIHTPSLQQHILDHHKELFMELTALCPFCSAIFKLKDMMEHLCGCIHKYHMMPPNILRRCPFCKETHRSDEFIAHLETRERFVHEMKGSNGSSLQSKWNEMKERLRSSTEYGYF
ncbi:putative Protein kinase domain containing protein [Blattamonas nauphoetae]|uniref:Protein kinase domain-containing protein n=1 Tax=Blattamonas nauphoetae TaxID=2049346 RepID=A0ABQ9Y963_9EUKA|nr:putative Protein kinase domain containing protein [Blattamonas nauphoetae]